MTKPPATALQKTLRLSIGPLAIATIFALGSITLPNKPPPPPPQAPASKGTRDNYGA